MNGSETWVPVELLDEEDAADAHKDPWDMFVGDGEKSAASLKMMRDLMNEDVISPPVFVIWAVLTSIQGTTIPRA